MDTDKRKSLQNVRRITLTTDQTDRNDQYGLYSEHYIHSENRKHDKIEQKTKQNKAVTEIM